VNDGVERAHHTGSDLAAFRRSSRAFEDLAAVMSIRQNLTGTDVPLQVQVGWASNHFFSLLGVEPVLGPGFRPDSPPGTLLLSYPFFADRFGADPGVLGRVVRLDDHPYTIAGVLPREFRLLHPSLPARIDVWKNPDDWWQNGDLWDAEGVDFAQFRILGRLADGATEEQAQQEMRSFAKTFREERIDYERAGVEYEVVPLQETVVSAVRPTLLLLFGAVGLVLLIACANVMNVTLARAVGRSREIGMRLALGGSPLRIARLLLAESLLVALVAGIAGIGVGLLGLRVIEKLRPENLPRVEQISLDGRVLAFALFASLLATLVFGLVPALTAARAPRAEDVRSGRAGGSRTQRRLGRALVVVQISLSLVLSIGAGLLTRSLLRLAEVRPGFETANLLTFAVSLPGTKYERPEGTDRFFRELEERIEALPGVARSGVVWPLPLSGRIWSNTYTAGKVFDAERAYAEYRLATAGYFETMGIPLVDGRSFSPGDPRHTVLVSSMLAERAWPGESPMGRTLRANPWGGQEEEFEVIGVVGDVRHEDLRRPPIETIYFDSRGWSWTDWEVDFVVGSTTPRSVVPLIQEELSAMDPSIPMARVRLMSDYMDDHLAPNRFALSVIGLFAVAAGLLAALGLYGVLSYSVSERRKEIGIRIALGAGRLDVLSFVIREGAALTIPSVALGLGAALLTTRFLAAHLYGVASTDFETFAALAFGVFAVAALASLPPAVRATKVDPGSVLSVD
jgi:predicted permease